MRIVLILFVVSLFSCSGNYNEPIVTEMRSSNGSPHAKYGKYHVIISVGDGYQGFWTDKEYKIGDTLTKCK